jgi:hypothetical protein
VGAVLDRGEEEADEDEDEDEDLAKLSEQLRGAGLPVARVAWAHAALGTLASWAG